MAKAKPCAFLVRSAHARLHVYLFLECYLSASLILFAEYSLNTVPTIQLLVPRWINKLQQREKSYSNTSNKVYAKFCVSNMKWLNKRPVEL